MSFTRINPPGWARGYDVERAAINMISPKIDKRGSLFLADDMLIYHGNKFDFHVHLRDVTIHEASAGIFESPFVKLSFSIPDKDASGTIKFNFNSRIFEEFASVFPTKCAEAREKAREEVRQRPPSYPIIATDHIAVDTNANANRGLPPITPIQPPPQSLTATNHLPAYPGLSAPMDTMRASKNPQKTPAQAGQQPQYLPYAAPAAVPAYPMAMNEQERRPLLEKEAVENRGVGAHHMPTLVPVQPPTNPRENDQALNTMYESTWGVVYNSDFDRKRGSDENQIGITQCLPPVMNYSS